MEHLIGCKHKIRDPIYGYIRLTDSELKIIDTQMFQRLRRIGQLALTKYVYPTAEHSRFVHSLGVLQAATIIFNEILRANPELRTDNDELIKNLKTLRFAALLHDIGHMPFSHAAETFFLGEKYAHEDVGKYIIQKTPEIKEQIEAEGISPGAVASLLKGICTKKLLFLKKIISDEFDADRADFLLRDSYFCGVKYGEYDHIRYVGSFRYINDEEQARFAIEKGNLHAVETFILARYHYYLQVPYHRTRTGYDFALKRYFEDLSVRKELPESGVDTRDGQLNINLEEYQLLDDYTVFEQIKKDTAAGNPWAKILMRQDRLHPIFDTEKDTERNDINFTDLQVDLVSQGLVENEDFFVFSKKISAHKLIQKSDEMGHETYPVVDKAQNNKRVGSILDFSSILEAVREKPVQLRRIYVTTSAKNSDETGKALEAWKNRITARQQRENGGPQ